MLDLPIVLQQQLARILRRTDDDNKDFGKIMFNDDKCLIALAMSEWVLHLELAPKTHG